MTNVVAVVLDDVGFGQVGCFGSGIETPWVDGLASGGLRYARFHVTAMCSPTRASFLTGRNHHAVGMGFLTDLPLSYPGYRARIPGSAASLARLLRDAGYSTLAVGKWHLTPRYERSAAGPFGTWPLGLGFERYYGFLQGDTNQWAPNLVADNHYVDPPARPEDGYHLSQDLADTAIRFLLDQQQASFTSRPEPRTPRIRSRRSGPNATAAGSTTAGTPGGPRYSSGSGRPGWCPTARCCLTCRPGCPAGRS
jgi:arylsulfatase A-like enzyme